MRRHIIAGLVLAAVLGITSSAQAGVRFSFGFGIGHRGYHTGFRPYYAYRPVYVYRPYIYGYEYAPYYSGYRPYHAPRPYYYERYYYRPAPVFRARTAYRGRVYSDYVPRRYHRYR